MRFDVVTLFPGYFASPFDESLVGRAVEAGLLDLHVVDLRDFSEDPHRKVDDEPYGGGPGMVLTAPPVFAAVEALRAEADAPSPHVVFLRPGRTFDAALAKGARGAARRGCVRTLTRIDERTREAGLFDEEISPRLRLSGGAAALAIAEAVSPTSLASWATQAAFTRTASRTGFDHPHYSRPREFRGPRVPDVLFSGHHEKIRLWRARRSSRRPREAPGPASRGALSDEERSCLRLT